MLALYLLFVLAVAAVNAQYIQTAFVKSSSTGLQFATFVLEPSVYRVEAVNASLAHALLLAAESETEVVPRISLQSAATSSSSSKGRILTTVSVKRLFDNGLLSNNRTTTGLRLRVHLPAIVSGNGKQRFTVTDDTATTTLTFTDTLLATMTAGACPGSAWSAWSLLLAAIIMSACNP